MDDAALLRYSRHLLLNEFGVEAQERLLAAHAFVVGAGGLGSSALMFLATSGVGRITVADGDAVDITNLQRQIAHRADRIGLNKAESAVATLRALNPTLHCEAVPHRLSEADLAAQVATADVVLDCSDNFATRYALNAACVQYAKPLVSGAAIRFDGQLAVYDLRDAAAPCYQCVFPRELESDEERCAVMGVFAPLVGVVGTLQAQEAIKVLTSVGAPVVGRLALYDALNARWHEVRVRKDPACKACGQRPLAGTTTSEKEMQHV